MWDHRTYVNVFVESDGGYGPRSCTVYGLKKKERQALEEKILKLEPAEFYVNKKYENTVHANKLEYGAIHPALLVFELENLGFEIVHSYKDAWKLRRKGSTLLSFAKYGILIYIILHFLVVFLK